MEIRTPTENENEQHQNHMYIELKKILIVIFVQRYDILEILLVNSSTQY